QLRERLAEKNEDISGLGREKLTSFTDLTDDNFLAEIRKERPYLSVVAERAAEAFDSIFVAKGRVEAERNDSGRSGAVVTKPRVVILGTGWASHALLKSIDANKYDVIVVAPRNFFLFTPMLAASAVGTVEYRSITEPIRRVNPKADYLEATATAIDSAACTVDCENIQCEASGIGTSCTIESFTLSYDYLVVGVGATTNTFGTPGVREHCLFLKQIGDAERIRRGVGNCFERANLPGLTDAQRRAALTFVVVGAGPTGVELTAELRDFIEDDVPNYYPDLLKYVSIKLVEASDRVLMAFDEELQKEAVSALTQRRTKLIEAGLIEEEVTEVLLQIGVKKVTDTAVELSNGQASICLLLRGVIPYGLVVWAAGNGPLPLVLDLIDSLPEQKERAVWGRGRLVTDDWLRVKGAPGVFAAGDCAVIDDKPLPQTAQVAAQQGTYLGRLFSRDYEVTAVVPAKREGVATAGDGSSEGGEGEARGAAAPPLALSEQLGLGMARGRYAKPFQFLNLGILAYVGDASALAQLQVDQQRVKGTGAAGFLLWRSIYLSKQVSWRNRAMVAVDWMKTRIFGRDITRF
ncbi:unnamed protein product, partial [Phaeothamnion confervicola]